MAEEKGSYAASAPLASPYTPDNHEATAPYPVEPPPPYEAIDSNPYNNNVAIHNVHEGTNDGGNSSYGVTAAPRVVIMPNFGSHPSLMTCPHCLEHVRTSVTSEPGAAAFITGCITCVLGMFCCLCCLGCIPCCLSGMKIYTHTCPKCKRFLGRYRGSIA